MKNPHIENIVHDLEPIALIIKADFDEPGIHFFTPSNFSQQVAFMKHKQGKKIAPHVHNPVNRQVLYTQEVLLIRRGRVRDNLYSSKKEFIISRIIEAGDVIGYYSPVAENVDVKRSSDGSGSYYLFFLTSNKVGVNDVTYTKSGAAQRFGLMGFGYTVSAEVKKDFGGFGEFGEW